MIWIVMCVLRELEKNECNYVFGGLYLSFLNIVLGKSLRFWWLVPSFPSISLLPFFLLTLFYLIYEEKSSIKCKNNNKKYLKTINKE